MNPDDIQIVYEDGDTYAHLVGIESIVDADGTTVLFSQCGLPIYNEAVEFNVGAYEMFEAPGVCPYCMRDLLGQPIRLTYWENKYPGLFKEGE